MSPLLADFVAEVGDDRRVAGGTTFLIGRLLPSKGWCGTAATELCTALCKAVLGDRRRSDDELCESAEVLRDCGQCELELRASRTEPISEKPQRS